MTRQFTNVAVAAACVCAFGIRADAQKTKVEAEHGKTITYTGCIQTGTEPDAYIFANVIPMSESETRGTTGTVEEHSFLLVPDKIVTFREHVGERAQITGVVIEPGHGDAKIETRTREDGATSKTEEKVKRGPLPQFRVVSVKPLGEHCR